MSVTGSILAGVGAAGAIGGAAISSNAASNAASTQANAATTAAADQLKAAQESLGLQEGIYNNNLGLASPFYEGGLSGLTNLESLLGILPQSANTSPIPTPQPINVPGIPGGTNPGATNLSSLTPGGIQSAGGPNGPPMSGPFGVNPGGGPVINPITGQPEPQPRGLAGQPLRGVGNLGPMSSTARGTTSVTSPGATSTLSSLVNPQLGAPGSLLSPFLTPFQPPTAATEANDPGYQFRMNQGIQGIQNSAAARGDLLSGNTLQSLDQFNQDYASNEYGNVYQRALNNYLIPQNNATSIYNRLTNLAGLGQGSLQQLMNTGAQTGANIGNSLTSNQALIGQNLQNAAAATASGYVGGANAYGGALGNLGQLASLPFLMNYLNNNQGVNVTATAG